MSQDVYFLGVDHAHSSISQIVSFAGPVIATVIGALAAYAGSYFQTTAAERRRDTRDTEITRRTIYTELNRIAVISDNQFGFVLAGNGYFILVPVFRTFFPLPEIRTILQKLTPEEAGVVTEFSYGYQEHISYILGNAQGGGIAVDALNDKVSAIGYSYKDKVSFERLLWSMYFIEEGARRAANVIGSFILSTEKADSDLWKLVEVNRARQRNTKPFSSANGPFTFPEPQPIESR